MTANRFRACSGCLYGKRLYALYYGGKYRTKYYYCLTRKSLTAYDGMCDCRRRRTTAVDLSPQRFDEAENDIRRVAELLRRDDNGY